LRKVFGLSGGGLCLATPLHISRCHIRVKSVVIMVARYAKVTIMVTSYAKSGRQVSEAVREWAERAEHALVRASPVLDFPGTDGGESGTGAGVLGWEHE